MNVNVEISNLLVFIEVLTSLSNFHSKKISKNVLCQNLLRVLKSSPTNPNFEVQSNCFVGDILRDGRQDPSFNAYYRCCWSSLTANFNQDINQT